MYAVQMLNIKGLCKYRTTHILEHVNIRGQSAKVYEQIWKTINNNNKKKNR